MRLSNYLASIVAASSLGACGKSETPAPAPTPTPSGETTPTPPVVPEEPATVEPKPDEEPVVELPKGPAYIVWVSGANGVVSHWLVPGAKGYEALATRPQLAVYADDTLWGLERPVVSYKQLSCDDFENETDDAPAKPSGALQTVDYLSAKGLAGQEAGKALPLTEKLPDYFQKDPDAKGIYTIIGELWGRQLSVVGGAGDLVFIVDCASAFSCGAHGDTSCQFLPFTFGEEATKLDLAAATKALSGATKDMFKAWNAELDGEELEQPQVESIAMRVVDGAPALAYLFVGGVSYAASEGDWSSYTQSRTHTGPIVPELGLPAAPAEVSAWLATQTVGAAYGWSTVPVDTDPAILAAFKDAATVPAPRPPASAVDAGAVPADANGMIKRGRELTRDGKLDDAIATFTTALELDPKAARAWSGRGYARLRASDLEGANADFTHALTLDDSAKFRGAVNFNLGELSEKKGDTAAALAFYIKSNELAPSAGAAKRIADLTTK